MSALVDRISAALREHLWYFVGNLGVPGMPDQRGYKCSCGWETHADGDRPADDPHAHVAAAVAAELNLTEEHARYDEPHPHMRWVSPWAAVEVKP